MTHCLQCVAAIAAGESIRSIAERLGVHPVTVTRTLALRDTIRNGSPERAAREADAGEAAVSRIQNLMPGSQSIG